MNESMELAKVLGMRAMVGNNLRRIGLIYLAMGRYQDAMDYFERSLQIARETRDEWLETFSLNSIGVLYQTQGHKDAAKNYFIQSLEKGKKAGNRRVMALNFNGLGDICLKQKDYQCMIENYKQSLALSEALGDKKGLASTFNKLGRAYLQMRKIQTALHYMEKSQDMARQIGMKSLVVFASLNIGNAYSRMGRLDEALQKTDEALAILREVPIPLALHEGYHMKGVLSERKGNISGALKNYEESVKILETLREDIAGGEEEMLAFLETKGRVYQRLISLLLRQGKVSEALQYLERSRLQSIREQFDLLNPTLHDKEEEKAREKEKRLREQIEKARGQLTDEKSKPEEKQETAKIAQLEKALSLRRQEYIEYTNDLREKFPELASLVFIQPEALIDLQNLVPPNVAIIQYLILEEQLYIFLVAHETLLFKEVKVSQTDLEGEIDYFRSLLMNPQIAMNLGPLEVKTLRPKNEKLSDLYEMFVGPFLKTSQALYHRLIKPVEPELSRYNVLGIIPNGKLHLLPFQALGEANPEGEFRFLLEDKEIFYLNSQSILKFAQKRAKEIEKTGKLIAFGNPDNSLRYAEEEIESIKAVFPTTATFLRGEATEDKIKTKLTGFDVLHLATHARLRGNIKESYILLAPSSDGKEDGKLFIREIWGLNLMGYHLVTLSACETAKGKEASGDVVVSLETAFLRAGAPAIVASLWGVDDQATGILMKNFYHNLPKQGKTAALRGAQMALLKNPQYVYPYYWAPFILVGDWR